MSKCPDCGAHFSVEDLPLDTEDAATALLSYYKGENPSLGDVLNLKQKIEEILVKEFGVSSGKI